MGKTIVVDHENPPVDYTPGAAEIEARELPEEIVVFDYQDIVFFYPVILAGIILLIPDLLGMPARISGTLWMACIVVSFLAIVPIPRNVFVILGLSLVVLVLLVIIGRFLGISFGWLWTLLMYFFCPKYSGTVGLAITTFLSLLLGVSYALSRFDNKWVINSNQWQRVKWWSADMSISHGANTVTADYTNVFKLLLLRAGSIVIADTNGKQIAVIKNVLDLPHRWAYIQEYLEEVRVRQVKPSFR